MQQSPTVSSRFCKGWTFYQNHLFCDFCVAFLVLNSTVQMQHSKGVNAPQKQLSFSTHWILIAAVVDRTGQQAYCTLDLSSSFKNVEQNFTQNMFNVFAKDSEGIAFIHLNKPWVQMWVIHHQWVDKQTRKMKDNLFTHSNCKTLLLDGSLLSLTVRAMPR